MKQTEFEEMVAINLALGGKYDAVVDEVGKVLEFGMAEEEENIGKKSLWSN